MTEAPPAQLATQPAFSPRAVLALVLFGFVVFIALLWMIGAGMTTGSTNNGGAHVGSKGLTGYAALADYLERTGHPVRRSQSEAALDDPGLLVLTPDANEDGEKLARLVEARRRVGPTLVITPKWIAGPAPQGTPGAKKGWVMTGGATTPNWKGFLDEVSVAVEPMAHARWIAASGPGSLPNAENVLWANSGVLVPLVAEEKGGHVLAGWIADEGEYPELENITLGPPPELSDDVDNGLYPLVVVFESDLLNNYGFSQVEAARLTDVLFPAMGERTDGSVTFDLTLNGFARSANLLTLAFTPPYLAATLCLLLAALAVGWRAFRRFGPAARAARAIAFGKRALVANAAGLIARAGRAHLVGGPYADAARERLARALALPRMRDVAATEEAIDRALAGRDALAEPFSAIAARMRAARRPHDMLRAAQDLHSLERMLTR